MSTIQVDRIIPYQSSSVTIEGDVTFTGAVSTGSFNTYTASNDQKVSSLESFTSSQEVINSNLESTTASLEISVSNLNGFTASQETLNSGFATTGSNTFQGNQTINGYVAQTFDAPNINSQIDNFTLNGVDVNGTPYGVMTVGWQDYGGDTFQDVYGIEYADSYSFNYYNGFFINGKSTTMNLALSGSGGGVQASMRMRPNLGDSSKVDTSIWGDTLLLASYTNPMTISGSAGIGVEGGVTLNNALTLTSQDPLPEGSVGQLAVSASNLYFYTDQWKQVSLVP